MQILLNSVIPRGRGGEISLCVYGGSACVRTCMHKRAWACKFEIHLTWVRRHIVFPSLQTGGGVKSHLELFQAPVGNSIIRDEDQLVNPVILTVFLKMIIREQMMLQHAKINKEEVLRLKRNPHSILQLLIIKNDTKRMLTFFIANPFESNQRCCEGTWKKGVKWKRSPISAFLLIPLCVQCTTITISPYQAPPRTDSRTGMHCWALTHLDGTKLKKSVQYSVCCS